MNVGHAVDLDKWYWTTGKQRAFPISSWEGKMKKKVESSFSHFSHFISADEK